MNCFLLLIILFFCSGRGNNCCETNNWGRNLSSNRSLDCNVCDEREDDGCGRSRQENTRSRQALREYNQSQACDNSPVSNNASVCQTPPPMARTQYPFLDSDRGNCGCDNCN